MTKKHFLAIANVIKTYHESEEDGSSYNLAEAMADVLENYNPLFDYKKFLKACEPVSYGERIRKALKE